MNKKNFYLFAAIITSIAFIGYLGEPGPHDLFGFSINIWIVRLAWFIIAATNINNYLRIRNSQKLRNHHTE